MLNKFKRFFGVKEKLSCEAFTAYFNKLPDRIKVGWFRSGKFIIGNITVDGEEFMTQAESAKEFVEMVNDTILAVYEVPENYVDAISRAHGGYIPNEESFEQLNNLAVEKSDFSLSKKLEQKPCKA